MLELKIIHVSKRYKNQCALHLLPIHYCQSCFVGKILYIVHQNSDMFHLSVVGSHIWWKAWAFNGRMLNKNFPLHAEHILSILHYLTWIMHYVWLNMCLVGTPYMYFISVTSEQFINKNKPIREYQINLKKPMKYKVKKWIWNSNL